MVWIVGCTGTPAVEARGDAPRSVGAAPVAAPATAKTDAEVKTIAAESEPQPVPVKASGPVAVTPQAAANSGEPPRFPTPPPVDASAVPSITPGWQVVQTFDREVRLEPLDGGIVCRIDGVPHELGPDGALVAKPAIDLKTSARYDVNEVILGVWPDDAWRVRERTRDRLGSLLTFMRWRGNNRWVAQNTTEYDQDDLAAYRRSPRGGIVLTADFPEGGTATFERIAGEHPPPAAMRVAEGRRALDLYETADGALFLFVEPHGEFDGPLEILRSCEDATPGCERAGGAALGSSVAVAWHTGAIVTRQRRSISAAIFARAYAGADRSYLVHHETGGWKLEAVPGDAEVEQLLPAPDGGLWIATGREKPRLWHRSAAGRWAAVAMPERWTAGIVLARRDDEHVWLAVNAGDHHAIYAAPAVQQAAAGTTEAGGQG